MRGDIVMVNRNTDNKLGYGNYDGVLFGFSDKEPGFWKWDV